MLINVTVSAQPVTYQAEAYLSGLSSLYYIL